MNDCLYDYLSFSSDVKVYKLNPVTKRAILFKGAQRRFNRSLPTLLKTHGNTILIFDDSTVLVTTKSLKKWIPLVLYSVLQLIFQVLLTLYLYIGA